MEKEVKLTKLANCAGCGAKVGAGVLAKLLDGLKVRQDPNLLVGFDKSDDASVYKVSDDLALVQTVDFFPPIADDPYTFGAIAATIRCWSNFIACSLSTYLLYALQYQCGNILISVEMFSPKLRFDAQGIMMPTVLSQAALHRIPTRALSLPPEFPKMIPLDPLFSTSSRIHLTRPSYSAFQSLLIIKTSLLSDLSHAPHHKKSTGNCQAIFHTLLVSIIIPSENAFIVQNIQNFESKNV